MRILSGLVIIAAFALLISSKFPFGRINFSWHDGFFDEWISLHPLFGRISGGLILTGVLLNNITGAVIIGIGILLLFFAVFAEVKRKRSEKERNFMKGIYRELDNRD